MRDPYAVLGVDRRATVAEIKAAYRSLAKKWHPDRHGDDTAARERFVEIGDAYQALIHPRLRDEMVAAPATAAKARRATKPSATKQATGAGEPEEAGESADAMLERIFGKAARRAHVDDAPGMETETETEIEAEVKAETPESPSEAPAAAAPTERPAAPERPSLMQRSAVLSALNALFGGRARAARLGGPAAVPLAGVLPLQLAVALAGGVVEAILDDGRTVAATVPAGTLDGSRLRATAVAGDAAASETGEVELIVRHVATDAVWSDGVDLHGTLPVPLDTAILGGQLPYETLDGSIRLTVPGWSGSDRILRVKGRGLPKSDGERGDFFVHLRVILSEMPDTRLIDLMKTGREGFYV